jgi:Ca-activated chloride channel homolog
MDLLVGFLGWCESYSDLAMFSNLLRLGLVLLLPLGSGGPQSAGRPQDEAGPYTLMVPVDEVSLTFHASDFHGMPIEDLTERDLRLLDDGKRQDRILSFQAFRNLPIRAGILFDTSRSMEGLWRNQDIAAMYATRLLRKETDQAFVMRFDSATKVKQSWTNNAALLTESLRTIALDRESRLGGTVLFDSLYKACRDQWTSDHDAITGNFILLFTDGVDNASHARLEDVIDICQQARTAIYVFSDEAKSFHAEGQKTLDELVKKSGGRIFFDATGAEVWNDLRIMESDQRSQYRMVYKPSSLKPDGSFHRIKLDSPTRGGVITTRSGYYAAR